jgi:hypothetical protein
MIFSFNLFEKLALDPSLVPAQYSSHLNHFLSDLELDWCTN